MDILHKDPIVVKKPYKHEILIGWTPPNTARFVFSNKNQFVEHQLDINKLIRVIGYRWICVFKFELFLQHTDFTSQITRLKRFLRCGLINFDNVIAYYIDVTRQARVLIAVTKQVAKIWIVFFVLGCKTWSIV